MQLLGKQIKTERRYGVNAYDMVTFDRGGEFAMKAYKCNPNKWQHLGLFRSKLPKTNIMFEEALKKKSHPAPNQYIKCRDWAKESNKNKDNFQKFMYSKRITQTEEILAQKKLRIPGPQTYKVKDVYKIQSIP